MVHRNCLWTQNVGKPNLGKLQMFRENGCVCLLQKKVKQFSYYRRLADVTQKIFQIYTRSSATAEIARDADVGAHSLSL